MASSNRSSMSSITKLHEDEDLDLLDLLEKNGILLQCEVNPQNTRFSDKSTSCSTRSSYATISPTPDDNYYECFDYTDEEKKRPDSDEESVGTDDDLVTIHHDERTRVEREEVKQNICHNVKAKENENDSNIQQRFIETNGIEERRRNLFCFCSTTCLVKYLGVLLFLVGVLYAFSIWSFLQLAPASTFNYVQGPLPICLPCTTMIFTGLIALVTDLLHKHLPNRRYILLVLFVLVLSVACTLFCGFSLIYLIGVIQDSLHQLNGCSFDELDRICSCYGPNHKIFKFAENLGCNAVKDKLKELAYGVSILFGVGCLISLATATAAGFLLCRERRNRNHRVEYTRSRLERGSTTVQNESAVKHDNKTRHKNDVHEENDDDNDISETHRLAAHHLRQERTETSQPANTSQRTKLYHAKRDSKRHKNRHSHKTQQLLKQRDPSKNTKITSVATQTPNYMIPVSSLMYDVIDPNTEHHHGNESEDTYSELSIDATLSPPSYTEAVKVLKKDKY
ncbi:uncharacterized protein [Clytia hemisphaerica]|uniref:Uncharacterized protein n=1 Tax=Clytia hemisphaerica TaxID=252671 RepID=A0A7M5WUI0_9CNID|eukprot:TCONS_00054256-protein